MQRLTLAQAVVVAQEARDTIARPRSFLEESRVYARGLFGRRRTYHSRLAVKFTLRGSIVRALHNVVGPDEEHGAHDFELSRVAMHTRLALANGKTFLDGLNEDLFQEITHGEALAALDKLIEHLEQQKGIHA